VLRIRSDSPRDVSRSRGHPGSWCLGETETV
jgi:hypothetical protein